jgi:hypothetical protein
MAAVVTLKTHDNPPGVRRNPGDIYDTLNYAMLADLRLARLARDDDYERAKEEKLPDNKMQVARPASSTGAAKKRKHHNRRDMTTDGKQGEKRSF